ncbi:DMT family transporter [Terasakiella sp.]|uniref:DMT family transporter n=1 Tax=Terasakiella sp. TaxID=2034861 RepID=UPI003AA8CB66
MGRMRAFDWGLLLTLSLLWGGSFFFTEIALREITPLVTVWGRVALACIILWIILRFRSIKVGWDRRLWAAFLVMGCLNNVIPFSLIVWGQQEISGSLASIFNATTPFFTVILAQFLTQDERLTLPKAIGLLIGFSGVVIMVGMEALHGLASAFWSQAAILLAAISYGCAAIWGRRFKGIDPMVTATGQVTASSLIMTPLALWFGFPQGYFIPSGDVLGAILGIACLCTVAAYILYFKILETSGATNLMLVTFLIPLSAITLGNVFLQETLSTDQIAGMVLILLGLLIMDGRMLRSIRLKTMS